MKTFAVEPDVKKHMDESSSNFPTTRWAVYKNQALDSASAGHQQYLAIGPGNTYQEPPEQMPDGPHGLGWKYRFIGWVEL